MVKSSKRQQQLHDILGLRIIVSESMLPWNRPSITTSDALDFDSNSILVEEVDNVDPLVPLDSTVVNKDQAVDLDDYQYDDFSDEYEDEDDIHKEFAVWRVHDVITESLADSSSTESVDSGKSSTSSSSSGDALTVESLSDEPLDDVDTDAAMYVDCMNEWAEDLSRFKDYVTEPKPSGYQSLHMTLMHRQTGIRLEVQIRSQRMHLVAEYGTAAHRNYKALALPATSSAKWRTE